MCLIVAKPKGKPLPSNKKLKQWFTSYPHGLGIAFQYQGKVRLMKGAMDVKGMFDLVARVRHALKPVDIRDVDIVMQFRIAVTGSICPAYCHPFPISAKQEELNSLDVLTDCALAHNGTIFEYSPFSYYDDYGYGNYISKAKPLGDINDAQEFIKDYLVGMDNSLWNASVQKLIAAYTESKFALLTNRGFTLIGQFIEDGGCYYSNFGYLPPKPVVATKVTGVYGQRKVYKPYEPYEQEISAGVYCDGCEEYKSALYYMPDDDQSLVCGPCYLYFTGKQPTMEEQVF